MDDREALEKPFGLFATNRRMEVAPAAFGCWKPSFWEVEGETGCRPGMADEADGIRLLILFVAF